MIIHGDSLHELKDLATESVDFVCTDPPYGYSFMGKDWDKAVPSVDIWRECLRVLKPGAFMAVMSAPRSDVQNAMISRLMEAGFRLDFTPIYWTYASGFPKAGNIGKLVDKRKGTTPDQSREFAEYIKVRRLELGLSMKTVDQFVTGGSTNYNWFEGRSDGQRLPKVSEYEKLKQILKLDNSYDEFIGEAEREVIGKGSTGGMRTGEGWKSEKTEVDITTPATPQAKALDGSYAGFQPKPAVEVILVAMKPLSEKTYVDQALANGKGISWLDDCRIPTDSDTSRSWGKSSAEAYSGGWENNNKVSLSHEAGRFPANLLASDDVLNDGRNIKSGGSVSGDEPSHNTADIYGKYPGRIPYQSPADTGSYSRYFDLDKWASTLPFLIVPKASKSEKNAGLELFDEKAKSPDYRKPTGNAMVDRIHGLTMKKNHHPTVKPLKLMSYLITLFSRAGDTVLDPFVGSGTTCLAAKKLKRKYIGIEREADYVDIANARLGADKQEVLL